MTSLLGTYSSPPSPPDESTHSPNRKFTAALFIIVYKLKITQMSIERNMDKPKMVHSYYLARRRKKKEKRKKATNY